MALTIYEQIIEDIQKKISKGVFKPGDMIPSENQLAKEYNSSRTTIHKGLSQLSKSGFIYSVHGKGNFVCAPDSKFVLHFKEKDIIDKYLEKVKLLEVNIINPPDKVKKHLIVHKNGQVIIIRRLFISETGPFAYDEKYIPYEKSKPVVEEIIQYATFPEIVAKMASLFSVKNEITIFVKAAEKNEMHNLQVIAGYPIMVIEEKYYNDSDFPIGWGQLFFKGDYCKLNAVSSFNNLA